MTTKLTETTIEILGKTYQIKCPVAEVETLQSAARYLEEKMRKLRDSAGVYNLDRLAVIAALNVVHQLQAAEQQKETHIQMINERLHAMQAKIETALFVK